jgi:hypothetical protein
VIAKVVNRCRAEPRERAYGQCLSTDQTPAIPTIGFVTGTIIGRFCLLRPTSAYIDRLCELKEVDVDQIAVYLLHDEQQKTLVAYATRSSCRFPEVHCGYAVRHDTSEAPLDPHRGLYLDL